MTKTGKRLEELGGERKQQWKFIYVANISKDVVEESFGDSFQK